MGKDIDQATPEASSGRSICRVWADIGALLFGRLVSPILLWLLFFLLFAPAGIVMRAFGRDLLHLKRDPAAASYWKSRVPAPPPETMNKQY